MGFHLWKQEAGSAGASGSVAQPAQFIADTPSWQPGSTRTPVVGAGQSTAFSNPAYVAPQPPPSPPLRLTVIPPPAAARSSHWQARGREAGGGLTCARICFYLLAIFQVLCAVALVVIVAVVLEERFQLQDYLPQYLAEADGAASQGTGLPSTSVTVCYATIESVNLCLYAYWAAAASIIVSILLIVLQGPGQTCKPAARNGTLQPVSQQVMALLGLVWWTGAALVTTLYGLDANEAKLEHEGWRNASWILCWVLCGLFGAYCLAATIDNCCACFCRKADPSRSRDEPARLQAV